MLPLRLRQASPHATAGSACRRSAPASPDATASTARRRSAAPWHLQPARQLRQAGVGSQHLQGTSWTASSASPEEAVAPSGGSSSTARAAPSAGWAAAAAAAAVAAARVLAHPRRGRRDVQSCTASGHMPLLQANFPHPHGQPWAQRHCPHAPAEPLWSGDARRRYGRDGWPQRPHIWTGGWPAARRRALRTLYWWQAPHAARAQQQATLGMVAYTMHLGTSGHGWEAPPNHTGSLCRQWIYIQQPLFHSSQTPG